MKVVERPRAPIPAGHDSQAIVYARILGALRPARALVPVKELRHGDLVEVQAVAALRE